MSVLRRNQGSASGSDSFRKYPRLCTLQAHYGEAIETAYANEVLRKTLTNYIADSQRTELLDSLKQVKYQSILMDGSTDKGNVDEETFITVVCTLYYLVHGAS